MTPFLLGLALLGPPDSLAPRLLDDFEAPSAWSTHPADGVRATLHPDRGVRGHALRMDFDFQGGGGYAIMRRGLPLELPDNYAFSFWLRGSSPPNTLEFKLIDPSGENVWWHAERDRTFDGGWQLVTIRRRQISFAWGPLGGGELRRVAALELVITAGKGGGRGSIWVDDLRLTPLPTLGPYDATPTARATRATVGHPPTFALDGDPRTAWRALADTQPVTLTVDFRRPREFGGLTLRWDAGRAARDYEISLSDDGRHWRTVRRVIGGNGGDDPLYLPDSEARFVRMRLLRAVGASGYGLADLAVEPLAFGASRNAFAEAIAARAPAGSYPRYLTGERGDWTVVGQDGSREEALLGEDGAVEAGTGDFSVEPFLREGNRLLTWRDATIQVGLVDSVLPMPWVEWRAEALRLRITAFAIGPASASSVVVRYQVWNLDTLPRHPSLYLAVRPFQVNPSSQFLNTAGGVTRIGSLRWTGRALMVGDDRQVIPFRRPAGVGVTSFDGGDIVERLRAGALPGARAVIDTEGAASGAMAWPLSLAAGDSAEVAIEIPLTHGGGANLAPASSDVLGQAQAETAGWWHEALDRSEIVLPPSGAALAGSIRSTIGYILVNRDGAAIQPGARSYERSWIRDGALTSAALLRFGHPEVVREFITWYAGYQYPDGKVPCCVDRRGADPVAEHDSHGEFIYLVMEYWRHTHDHELLEKMWPHVRNAAAYLDSLRRTERTAPYRRCADSIFFGLLPPSISHEGYSAKPMHSYWDDLFALRGLTDAATMATVLGDSAAAAGLGASRDEFRADLLASLTRVMALRGIDYLPGAADLGDFDATSTTIALNPVGAEQFLPAAALRATFERYWLEKEARRTGREAWDAYTPYELRIVGAMLRLGWTERAWALLDGFLADQSPPAWHQWPEVVWHDHRALKFIGDLPHTWVGSDFLRSAADLFAWEREADSALVLGAGLRPEWLEGTGTVIRDLHTWWGPLRYTARRDGDAILVRVEATLQPPAGGLVLGFPWASGRTILLNGAPLRPDATGQLRVRALPAELRFQ